MRLLQEPPVITPAVSTWDLGDTIAILLAIAIIFTGLCAFLGWYSRRNG